MSNVHLLPESLIAKIAAGEVIDRPASVIKELLENSLDAGATHIQIRLKDAGKDFIEIKDNGSGILKEDLEKIFLRHATSKIKDAEDLFNIHSLGFRGEALYSVAAISDITLKTRHKDEPEAWEIQMLGGKQIGLRPTSFNDHGTHITIKELFFNTPARKKFLKTNSTEIHYILNIIVPYTLLHKNVGFQVFHQDRSLIDIKPTENLKDRIHDVLNLDQNFLLEARRDRFETCPYIKVILGDINIKRNRRDMQFMFVNGRPVQNKNIAYHMNQIFRLIMPHDFFPFFAVFIDIPANDVDVNIHPTKREVKIKNEYEICSHLRSLCENTLMKQGRMMNVRTGLKLGPTDISQSLNRAEGSPTTFDSSSPSDIFEKSSGGFTNDYTYPRDSDQGSAVSGQHPYIPNSHLFDHLHKTLHSKLETARYIGCFIKKFLLFETDGALLIIDQHAAAERITYEKIIRQMNQSKIEVQPLLVPIVLKVTAQEMLLWEENKEELTKMGFETNQFDNESIAVQSHPHLLKDPEKAVRDILSGEKVERCDFDTLARRACRSSIMTGDKLVPEQAENMKKELLTCLDPYTCPHGRPTIIEMSADFLDKQFLRT